MGAPPPPDRSRGLYETALVLDGRPAGLDRHLARLGASVRAELDAELPDDLAAGAVEACAGIAFGRLRIDLTRDPGGSLAWTAAAEPIDTEIFFPPWERGAELRSVEAGGWSGAHKWADRGWLEGREAELGDAVPLLVDEDGAVLEAARANVFAVLGGEGLATPPVDGRILPGTGRAATLALAADLGIAAVERRLTLADLHDSGEVFLTSSLRGIRPARSLDGAELPSHELTDRLAAALRERYLAGD